MNPARDEGVDLEINGIEMHVALRGDGEPLLLLHGGGGAGAVSYTHLTLPTICSV